MLEAEGEGYWKRLISDFYPESLDAWENAGLLARHSFNSWPMEEVPRGMSQLEGYLQLYLGQTTENSVLRCLLPSSVFISGSNLF